MLTVAAHNRGFSNRQFSPDANHEVPTVKALVYLAVGKKALEDRPKPEIGAPTDAIVKITKTKIRV